MGTTDDTDVAERIERRIAELGDWRGETLGRMRELVLGAERGIVEEVKWVKPTNPHGVIAWSKDGLITTGEVYKDYVKLTFAHGAKLDDPDGLFNAGLGGGTRRAIDLRQGEKVPVRAFKALVRRAAAFNAEKAAARAKPRR